MKTYKLTVLVDMKADENWVVNNIKKYIKDLKADIEDVLFESPVPLLYDIDGEKVCRKYEATCQFNTNNDVAEFDKLLHITNGVLRHLLYVE